MEAPEVNTTGSRGWFQALFGALCPLSPAVLTQMVERPAKLVPGAMDIRLHGPQREVQRRRDLFVGAALPVPEHDARSILRSQPRDRTLDCLAQLARLELVERGFLLYGDVE